MGRDGDAGKCEPTAATQATYLREVLPALEECQAVYRYAWYTARCHCQGGANLLDPTSPTPKLTPTGTVYRSHALNMRFKSCMGAVTD